MPPNKFRSALNVNAPRQDRTQDVEKHAGVSDILINPFGVINPEWRKEIFSSPHPCRSALGTIQPPAERYRGSFQGYSNRGVALTTHPHVASTRPLCRHGMLQGDLCPSLHQFNYCKSSNAAGHLNTACGSSLTTSTT